MPPAAFVSSARGILRSMRIPLIAGNWKMHKTPSEALTWLGDFLPKLAGRKPAADVLLGVPATHLAAMAARAGGSTLALAGQDLSAFGEGAHTGEISGSMLRDAGATHVIVGHSERRADHGETDDVVHAKVAAAQRHGLVPILCIGETETQRDAGDAEAVVLQQLEAGLGDLAFDNANDLVIAYEPVWAIGTGRTASASDAGAMATVIRDALTRLRPSVAAGVRILYGGSMKPGNAAELLAQDDIDGGLIGGASLQVDDLLAILDAA